MDIHSEDMLEAVHPELAQRVRQMATALLAEDIEIRVIQGLRSWDEQKRLYDEGRDSSGTIVDAKRVVTHAEPGHSWHQFGLAVDVAPFVLDIPDWNVQHPTWQRIVAVGESCGLYAGATFRTFPDYPHFQLTGYLPVSPTDEIRQTFKDGGMLSVWKETGISE